MNSTEFVAKLKELEIPVFSLETVSEVIQKPRNYASLYVNRLRKEGIIRMIERGKYCLEGVDEQTIASRIIPYSYITGYAALEHYKLTTQITTNIQVIASRYHRPIKLSNYTVKFSKVKKSFLFGYIVTANGPVFADLEKVFIDDLYLHGRQYYSEELEYAMLKGKVNAEKLEKYAAISENMALIKAVKNQVKRYERETRKSARVRV